MDLTSTTRAALAAILLGLPPVAAAELGSRLSDLRAWGVARFAGAERAWLDGEYAGANASLGEDDVLGVYADPFGREGFAPERAAVTSLGIAWRLPLAAHERLRFSAQYDDVSNAHTFTHTASNYFAAVDWRGAYTAARRAHIGGSVYVGEESAEHEFGRRYFGLSADGSYALSHEHSPFLSLRLQRSDYADSSVPGANAVPVLRGGSEELSRVAAGWDWQVYPSWHIRAQAEYALNKSNLSLYEYGANRLFFTTRFDFR